MNYEYEIFIASEPRDMVQINSWLPIATDYIKHPEHIETYIKNGLLRRIESSPSTAIREGEDLFTIILTSVGAEITPFKFRTKKITDEDDDYLTDAITKRIMRMLSQQKSSPVSEPSGELVGKEEWKLIGRSTPASIEEILAKHIPNYQSEVIKHWNVVLFKDFSDNVSQKIIAAMEEYSQAKEKAYDNLYKDFQTLCRTNEIFRDENKRYKDECHDLQTQIQLTSNDLIKATDQCSQLQSQLTAKEAETKELKDYIYEIRPKHDAYDEVCKALGIENDIIGHFKNKESEVSYYKQLYESARLALSVIPQSDNPKSIAQNALRVLETEALKNQKPNIELNAQVSDTTEAK